MGTEGLHWTWNKVDEPKSSLVWAAITYSTRYKLDKYKKRHGIPTISAAVRDLLEKGLKK